jgi:soluble epoxide hydrolase/lipid-phosphate phosphatase
LQHWTLKYGHALDFSVPQQFLSKNDTIIITGNFFSNFQKATVNEPDSFNHCYATVNDIRYHYIDQGSGTPILLLHGFPDFWYGWRYQIIFLVSKGYRVIVPDLLGYGHTQVPLTLERFSYKSMSGDMIELMNQLDIDRFDLVGHDWGAVLSWRVSQYHPHNVKSLFVIAVPYPKITKNRIKLDDLVKILPAMEYQLSFRDQPVEFFDKYAEKLLDQIYGQKSYPEFAYFGEHVALDKLEISYLKKIYLQKGLAGPLNWYKTREINHRIDNESNLKSVKCKCQLVICNRDPFLVPAMSKSMGVNVPQCKVVHLDSSHWAMIEKPDDINSMLDVFLKEESRL